MIEPQRRRYDAEEQDRLTELFGDSPRWGDTLRPFLWSNIGITVPGFTEAADVDLPITCTYDMEVAAAKYFHALDGGEIPIVLLFSGTVFTKGEAGLSAMPIAWHEEAHYRLPVAVWRSVIEKYFPNSGWLRLDDDTLRALQQFRAQRALITWDETIRVLLKHSGESQ